MAACSQILTFQFVGKIFMGLGIGTNQLVTTPYVMEIAPNKTRGTIIIAGVIW